MLNEKSKDLFPEIVLFPVLEKGKQVIKRCGAFLGRLAASPQQFASHGDHLFEHAVGWAVMSHEITAEEGYQQLSFINEQYCVIGRIPTGEYFDGSL